MKKKNVLMMAMSLVMVAVIAVGGTLAYMSDKTDVVTNTFTTSASIDMNLKEHKVENGLVTSEYTKSNEYEDVLPDVVYPKDPSVQLTSVPTGGAYVFMAVEGLDARMDTDHYTVTTTINSAWKKVTVGAGLDGVYVYVNDKQTPVAAPKNNGDARMTALFNNVTFSYANDFNDKKGETDERLYNIKDINVVAFAGQYTGTSYETVAEDAVNALNELLKTQFALPQA